MERSFAIGMLVLCGAALLAAPAGSGGIAPPPPDGVLMLGVARHGPADGAVTSEWAVVADPRTGVTRRRRLAGGTLCHGPLLAVGHGVIFGGHRGRRAVARWLPLGLDGPARMIAEADTFTSSRAPGRLWLGRWRGRGRAARLALHQVDLRGRVSVRARILHASWSSLHADLGRFFVITRGRRLTVWDHFSDTRRLAIRDGSFAAAGGTRLAWCSGVCRRLHVWSPSGARVLEPPAGIRPLGPLAAFSPDGLRLATGVGIRGRQRLAVIELRTGRWTIVPGGELDGYRSIAWSPSSNWIYFTAGDRRLLAFRHGARRAVPLPIDPGGTVMSIAG